MKYGESEETLLEEVHPGVTLLEDFLEPFGISQAKLARDLDIPISRVNEVIRGQRGITADTAIRLGLYFGTTADFWWNLQTQYEMAKAQMKAEEIAQRVRPLRDWSQLHRQFEETGKADSLEFYNQTKPAEETESSDSVSLRA